jgi:hypothetical protein
MSQDGLVITSIAKVVSMGENRYSIVFPIYQVSSEPTNQPTISRRKRRKVLEILQIMVYAKEITPMFDT